MARGLKTNLRSITRAKREVKEAYKNGLNPRAVQRAVFERLPHITDLNTRHAVSKKNAEGILKVKRNFTG